MTTIALPDWLRPQTLVPPYIQRNTLSSVGRYSGATDVADMMSGDTWAMSIGLAPHRQSDSPRLQSLVNQLVGGLNLLQCHHLGSPLPLGTLRGSPVLSSAAAVGAQALTVSGALSGVNLLQGGSFEIDTNADGVADGWATYSNGSTGAVLHSLSTNTASGGVRSQLIQCAALGTTSDDRAGVSRVLALSGVAGDPVSVGIDTLASSSSKVRLFVQAIDTAAGNAIRGVIDVTAPQTGGWARMGGAMTATGPFNQVQLFIWNTEMPVAGASTMYLDGATLSRTGAPTNFAFAGLKAGDMLGLGNAIFQASDDVELDDAGNGEIPVVNKVRSIIASGTAVLWNRPAALWRMVGTPQMLLRPGSADGVQIDLVEKAFA